MIGPLYHKKASTSSGSGTIEVQEDGVKVLDASTLNFTNDDAQNITDGGSGEGLVAINPYLQQSEHNLAGHYTYQWKPRPTQTNQSIALIPRGTGGLLADVPDNTATGGNARGTNANDFQHIRSAATQVASGLRAVISGGEANTASGAHSAVPGGQLNTASGAHSVAMGNSNTSSGIRAVVMGIGNTGAGAQSATFGCDNLGQADQGMTCGIKGQNRIESSLHLGSYSRWSSAQGKTGIYIVPMSCEAANGDATSQILCSGLNAATYLRQVNLFGSDSSISFHFHVVVRAKTTAGAFTAGETYTFCQSGAAKNVGGTGSIVYTGTPYDNGGDASLGALSLALTFSIVPIGGINTVQASISAPADTNLYVEATAIVNYLTP